MKRNKATEEAESWCYWRRGRGDDRDEERKAEEKGRRPWRSDVGAIFGPSIKPYSPKAGFGIDGGGLLYWDFYEFPPYFPKLNPFTFRYLIILALSHHKPWEVVWSDMVFVCTVRRTNPYRKSTYESIGQKETSLMSRAGQPISKVLLLDLYPKSKIGKH
jgi:hypothetical protein